MQKKVLYCQDNFSQRYNLALETLSFADTIAQLRSPEGCPWDKEQDLNSLQSYLIEESYEAIEAVQIYLQNKTLENAKNYADELGDVLLQLYLNSQIASEENLFNILDVFKSINKKMIDRHPHVFASSEMLNIKNYSDVIKQWDEIKNNENGTKKISNSSSLLKKAIKKKGIPTLNFGQEISKRAKKLGFSWNTLPEIFGDVLSEIEELKEEFAQNKINIERVADEIGDVVYALCNLVQFLKETNIEAKNYDFDLLARGAIDKFINRFMEMEKIMEENGTPLSENTVKNISLEQWNDLWKQAKKRRYR
ncbi:MazG family protein [Pigmentibacter sp. JX0631]|uniref:nucleoside triphosphate pyrophosphohydrolase n=1 Tax=Pigmentibacter sp. JX0631 TaxID=2976982 RepID=UPI0024693F72|nr:MazG family protein [Pigmentibacter sp. JX0631]WGL59225.1 MazG family protein [Pigmentibacter sp. JX0631]